MAEKILKYRYSARAKYQWPNAVTIVPIDLTKLRGPSEPFVTVALGDKEVRRDIPGTADKPPETLIAQPASQEQLKYLFEFEHNPYVELYEEPVEVPPSEVVKTPK